MPTLEPFVKPIVIEPLDGVYGLTAVSRIPNGGSPDMINCFVRGNTLRKRPGFSQLGDTLSATERVMGIFSAIDEDDNTFLFATTQTGLQRYSAGTNVWTDYTGPALTGGTEKLFSWEISQNSVVFSQGVDQVMAVPFVGTTYAILNANCPAARYLTRFADRLYLAFTREGGANKPFRVRRSVNGDHTNWTGLGSGFNDLAEYPYHIKGMRKHAAQLLIGTQEAFWIGTRTGLSAAPARFDPIVPGTGIYCSYTLTTRGNDHLLMGFDHFYLFNGARAVEIGDPIRDVVFFNLEASKVHMNFAVLRPESQEWVVFICEAGTSTPQAAWVWNWHHNCWYKWTFSGPVCGTIHRQDATRTWNSLVGDWNAQTWEWTASQGTANFPLMVTGHTNGKVFAWKEEYASDDGNPIFCRWTSKDFSSALVEPNMAFRELLLKSLAIEYEAAETAATLSFYLSNDKGSTWQGPYSVTLAVGGGMEVLAQEISGEYIRWKFEHSSATERFRIARFIPEFEILGSLVSS